MSRKKTIDFIIEHEGCYSELPCYACYFQGKIRNDLNCTLIDKNLKALVQDATLDEVILRRVKELRAISVLKEILK
jgi:hypothetical protein